MKHLYINVLLKALDLNKTSTCFDVPAWAFLPLIQTKFNSFQSQKFPLYLTPLHVHICCSLGRIHLSSSLNLVNPSSFFLSCFSYVWLFVTPWTVPWWASLSKGFSRQEYWSGLPYPTPGDRPTSGIEPASTLAPHSASSRKHSCQHLYITLEVNPFITFTPLPWVLYILPRLVS